MSEARLLVLLRRDDVMLFMTRREFTYRVIVLRALATQERGAETLVDLITEERVRFSGLRQVEFIRSLLSG